MEMSKGLTSKLILLVLGMGLLFQWLHLSELVSHSESASGVASEMQRAPASELALTADDCSAPASHEGSDQGHDESCLVGCHMHCHANCRPAVLATASFDHALSVLHLGASSENILLSDPHYGSLLRPPSA